MQDHGGIEANGILMHWKGVLEIGERASGGGSQAGVPRVYRGERVWMCGTTPGAGDGRCSG